MFCRCVSPHPKKLQMCEPPLESTISLGSGGGRAPIFIPSGGSGLCPRWHRVNPLAQPGLWATIMHPEAPHVPRRRSPTGSPRGVCGPSAARCTTRSRRSAKSKAVGSYLPKCLLITSTPYFLTSKLPLTVLRSFPLSNFIT